ncbi:MAG: LapA family protein [Spirochaetota bacterium]|nr:MAG: LapA family protein [Spirochaetota bacterium]
MAKLIIGVIIGILVIVFMVQNVETVDIKFLAWSASMQRAIMILIVFVVGIGIGFVIRSIGYRKKKKREEEEEKKVKEPKRD